ncbi:MAG: hypothetical protein J4428_05275 [Candidatus Aenigmarchaeota archaeon]|nr:hypothetical protein [Candidatus Aenigmarchaeota archaeon]
MFKILMICVYSPPFQDLVREFYENGWETREKTQELFLAVGNGLTSYAFDYVLSNTPAYSSGKPRAIYAGAVARGGFGMFRRQTLDLIEFAAEVPVIPFGLGASRDHERPDELPADVYWDTLGDHDLTDSVVMVYDFGLSTAGTVHGVVNALRPRGLDNRNLIFLLGAACLEQSGKRLNEVADGMHAVVGSEWRYRTQNPGMFYLDQMKAGNEWVAMNPQDWGDCVSRLETVGDIELFLSLIGETLQLSPQDRALLFERYKSSLGN